MNINNLNKIFKIFMNVFNELIEEFQDKFKLECY
jgi:RNAse (barnase) inhibitor barstar